MKRCTLLVLLLITAISPIFCENVYSPVIDPLLPAWLYPGTTRGPADLGFFTAVREPVPVSEEGRKLLDEAVIWCWMSIGGFGASALSFIITHSVDRTVGGIMSLASAGFWTVSNLATAFTHGKISSDIKNNGSDAPRPLAAGVSSLVGGIIGIGAVTAISLIFGDTSGAAEISAYVSFGVSALAGGFGIFKTFEYASAAKSDLSFF